MLGPVPVRKTEDISGMLPFGLVGGFVLLSDGQYVKVEKLLLDKRTNVAVKIKTNRMDKLQRAEPYLVDSDVRSVPDGKQDATVSAVALPLVRDGFFAARSIPLGVWHAVNTTNLERRSNLLLVSLRHTT